MLSSIFYILYIFVKFLALLLLILIDVAYLTLAERKVLGGIQRRKSSRVVGVFGLLQPLADALKLVLKETLVPLNANVFLFVISPMILFSMSLMFWSILPLGKGIVFVDSNVGILYIYAISAIGVYGLIISGWAGNSSYGFLGSIRAIAQLFSYEVVLGLSFLGVSTLAGSTFNLSKIVMAQQHLWFCFPLFAIFGFFLVIVLAETNRHPFDLSEAEGELVAGYNVEYSGMGFGLFFMGEYLNIIVMSVLISILFLGGWFWIYGIYSILVFVLKVLIISLFFIVVRGAYPRYRYDQLMQICWQSILPVYVGFLFFLFIIVFSWDCNFDTHFHNCYKPIKKLFDLWLY